MKIQKLNVVIVGSDLYATEFRLYILFGRFLLVLQDAFGLLQGPAPAHLVHLGPAGMCVCELYSGTSVMLPWPRNPLPSVTFLSESLGQPHVVIDGVPAMLCRKVI